MRQAHNYFHISLSIPICRPWTSLGDTVFTQIVSSYNYERLIHSISTPFCLHNIYTHYSYLYSYSFIRTYILTPLLLIRPFYLSPLFVLPLFIPLLSTPFISTPLLVLIFVLLYSYSLFSYSLLFSPLYVHIICTPFSQKIFPKK